jgi:hypothetical protein
MVLFRASRFVIGLLIVSSSAVQAQDGDAPPVVSSLPGTAFGKAPVRLVYDHVEQTVSLLSPDGSVDEVWAWGEDAPFARVPTDRPVVVEVQNANALLYGYEVTASVAEVLPRQPTCVGRARSFVLAGGLAAGAAFMGGELPELDLDREATFGDFLDIGPLAGLAGITRGETDVATSDLIRIQQEGQRGLSELAALAGRLQAAVAATSEAVVRAARLGDSQPLDPLLAAIQADLEAVYPDLSDPAQTTAIALAAAEPTRQFVGALFVAEEAIQAGSVEDPEGALATTLIRLAGRARAVTNQAAQATDSLQVLALRITEARAATRQRTTLRPGGDIREIAIEIARAEDAVEGVRATRQRTVRAFLGPRASGLECNVAVSLVWTGRPAEYGVSPTGQLVNDAPPELRSSAAVLFEVAPPVVGRVLGLVAGAGIGNRAPDLYLGGSLRPLSPVLLTAGAVWQRTAQLPNGLALGSDIEITDTFDEDAFVDAFPRRWTPSLFVGISLIPTR